MKIVVPTLKQNDKNPPGYDTFQKSSTLMKMKNSFSKLSLSFILLLSLNFSINENIFGQATTNVTICGDFSCEIGYEAQRMVVDGMGVVNLNTNAGNNVWCATLSMTPGSVISYFFQYSIPGNAPAENLTPLSGQTCVNANGTRRVLTVPSAPQTFTYAWQSCVATPVCQTITNVTICGDFSCQSGYEAPRMVVDGMGVVNLNTNAGNNVRCATLSLTSGSQISYFFQYSIPGNAPAENLTPLSGQTCVNANGTRRVLTVPSSAQTFTYAWESCIATPNCGSVVVTICGDFSCQSGYEAPRMVVDGMGVVNLNTNAGNNVRCATLSMTPGSQISYFFQYSIPGNAPAENLTPLIGQSCVNAGGTRRVLTVPSAAQTFTYAWQSCVATPNCPPTTNVTICGDFSCQLGYEAPRMVVDGMGVVNLNTNAGNNVRCATLSMTPGSQISYFFQYSIPGNAPAENLTPLIGQSCVNAGGTRRVLTVPSAAQTFTYAWQSCSSSVVCPPPPAPSVAAPAPICNQANVISVYSDTYTNNIAGTNFNPNWSQSGFNFATTFSLGSNQMRYYPNMNYQGIALGSNQNISAFETLRLNIWSADCSSIDIYLVTVANGERAVRRSLTLNSWNSIEIPLTEYTAQGIPLTAIKEFKFVTINPGSGANIYVDNIYFARTNCTFPGIWREDGLNCGGDFTYNPSTQVFTGTSTNCYYPNPFSSDELAFATQNLCGNGSITALVTSISGSALGWAGVTMRESNAPGAKKAQLMTNLSAFSRREFRTTTGGQAYPQQFPSQGRYWLRITRTGNQFVMYVSPNGTSWFPAGAQNITMNNCIDVGLVITNYTENSTVNATFSNVSVTGGNPTRPAGNGNLADDLFADPDFTIMPNPTSGFVEINMSAYNNKDVQMEIYNLQGKLIRSATLETIRGIEEVDMSSFVNGMYIIRMKAEGLPDVTKRVVVQH